MKSRRRSLLQFLFLALCVSALLLAFAPSAQVQQDSGKVSTTSRGGLRTVNFDTFDGRVVVNFPDDITAGDTFSGTVVANPNGNTDEDRAKNMDELRGYVVEIKPPDNNNGKGIKPPNVMVPVAGATDSPGSTIARYRVVLPEIQPGETNLKQRSLEVNLRRNTETTGPPDFAVPVGTIIISTQDKIAPTKVTPTNSADDFRLPTIGQQGRPVEIRGPFDGSFENTNVMVGGEEVSMLAESPRKAVFGSPLDTTGLAEIVVREGKTETKGEFRNVRLRLGAPKTTLLKDESTTLTIKVLGLEALKQDVPLHLENTSPTVVRMQGGDKQTFRITPATVQPDGSFSTTRAITGQREGSFSVTATVVVFDHCLQDDSNPALVVLWNTFTGDYNFCSGPPAAGANPISFSTMDFSGGVFLATGDSLDLNKQGAGVLTLQSNNTDRRVLINLSAGSFPHSGSATLQTSNPKQTFTITDRDTRNNTCVCK